MCGRSDLTSLGVWLRPGQSGTFVKRKVGTETLPDYRNAVLWFPLTVNAPG